MEKKELTSLSDEELKSLYNHNGGKEYTNAEISNEVSKRINERAPIVGTNYKLKTIESVANGFTFDSYMYKSPYSCILNDKRVRFSSLEDMYYAITKDDSWYKQEHKHWTESEWWLGKTHPTSYSQWLSDRHITL